jgi:hypothetical protein
MNTLLPIPEAEKKTTTTAGGGASNEWEAKVNARMES